MEYLDALRDSGGKVLASAQATVEGKGISCKTVLAENVAGNVADIIVERARELQADVIVMGAHGRRGVRRLVLGGDVEGVVRTSPVPVLLVRSDTEPRTS